MDGTKYYRLTCTKYKPDSEHGLVKKIVGSVMIRREQSERFSITKLLVRHFVQFKNHFIQSLEYNIQHSFKF